MKKRYDLEDNEAEQREKIIGLGAKSLRKCYYPELRKKLAYLERFKTLIEQSNDAIFMMDVPSCLLIDVSKSACVQIGYTEDQCLRMTMFDLMPDNEKELHEFFSGKAESLVLETKLRKGSGVETPYEVNMRRVRFSGKEYVVAIARDITERKQYEESLKLTQFALDTFSDLAIWLSPAGKIVYVNRTACSTLGYSREELLSMYIWAIDPIFQSDRFGVKIEEIKQHGGTLKFESQLKTRVGMTFPVSITARYIRYGKSEYIISIVQDITDRKHNEKMLIEAKIQTELYMDLMGHDINNINMTAMGFLEMAYDKLRETGKLGIEDTELLVRPIENLKNSAKLIENLRKIQHEKSHCYKTERINVNRVLADVANQFSVVAGRDIKINFHPGSECYVLANLLLKDVFSNLVGNSIKHSKGALRVDISTSASYTENKRFCCITIEDNGPGIPDERKALLFDFSIALRQKIAGKGLGFYLVKTLVDDFHGKILVEDRVPGDYTKGAKFVVMLPVAGE